MNSVTRQTFASSSVAVLDPIWDDLIAYYKLDGDVLDSTPNAHHGTPTAITYGAGIINNGAQFNGSTSKIVIPDSSGFTFSNGTNDLPYSVSMWSKRPTGVGLSMLLAKGAHVGTGAEWSILGAGNSIYLFLYDKSDPTIYIYQRIDGVTLDSLNHLVITYNGSGTVGGIKWYVNAVLQSMTSGGSGTYVSMGNKTSNLVFGQDTAGSYPDTGTIDECGIFARELTSGNVTTLYNGGACITYPS